MSNEKIKEGDFYFNAGQKCIKKPFLPWSIEDWDGGSVNFEKAAGIYKVAKAYDKACSAYRLAAKCHKKCKITYAEAKNIDNAGDMLKRANKIKGAVEQWSLAAVTYAEADAPDKAALTYKKASQAVEKTDTKLATNLIQLASDILFENENWSAGSKYISPRIRLLCRSQSWEQLSTFLTKAIEVYKKINQPHNVYQMVLSQVIVLLHNDEYSSADRLYRKSCSYSKFVTSDESELCQIILDACLGYDQEKLDAVIKKHDSTTLGFVSGHIARLARNLKVDNIEAIGTAAPVIMNVGKLVVGQNTGGSSNYIPPSDDPHADSDDDDSSTSPPEIETSDQTTTSTETLVETGIETATETTTTTETETQNATATETETNPATATETQPPTSTLNSSQPTPEIESVPEEEESDEDEFGLT